MRKCTVCANNKPLEFYRFYIKTLAESLGFSAPKSEWYSAIKRVEIAARKKEAA